MVATRSTIEAPSAPPMADGAGRPPTMRVFLGDDEMIVDNFAGGGGASSGVSWAAGRSPDIAINHDPEAIAMHAANHPTTKHYIENIWQVDPVRACTGADGKLRPVGLLWVSPTCTHFSKAKGTALDESSIKIRGLAWVATRWAAKVQPRIICLENVEEFAKWGPLDKRTHKPIKSREGETFRAWVRKLERLGYVVEWKLLRAHEYGAPTRRRRLFLVARRDGLPIAWPEATHGAGEGKAKPRGAAECIDWSIPCPSIFERDRPLAEKTLARIARGVRKYVLESAQPFIVPAGYGAKGASEDRSHSADDPLGTVCGNRGSHSVVTPVLMKVKTYGGGGNDATSVEEPLGTITASKRGEFAIAVPYLVHRSNGERPAVVREDGTIAPGQAPRVYDIQEPIGTLMGQGQKHAVAVAQLVRSADLPRAVPREAKPSGADVAVAMLIKHNGGHNDECGAAGQAMTDPLDTISTRDSKSLSVAHLVKLRGTSESHLDSSSQDAREPSPTVSAGGTHVAAVSAFLVRYNGENTAGSARGQAVDEPLSTVDTANRFGLVTVTIEGEEYVVADIGMRMLTPRELFRCQGFSNEYVIDPIWNGKPLTKTAQVRMCGNSVPPQMAEAIARAQLAVAPPPGWTLNRGRWSPSGAGSSQRRAAARRAK